MFFVHRQRRQFVVYKVDAQHNAVVVEDLLSGLRIEVPYGIRDLAQAEFTDEYELHFIFQDGSEKSINLLMQGY